MDSKTFWRRILFILMIPLMVPVTVFLAATYDWWAELSDKNKILFFALMPIYGPLALINFELFEWWSKLAKE